MKKKEPPLKIPCVMSIRIVPGDEPISEEMEDQLIQYIKDTIEASRSDFSPNSVTTRRSTVEVTEGEKIGTGFNIRVSTETKDGVIKSYSFRVQK